MIVILGGVAGSGKSVVGTALAARLGWTFEDSDVLHSPAEVAKMHSGVPLTDADRWPWLARVGAWLDQQISRGESAVIACSVLKRSYREFLCQGRPATRIVLLEASEDTLKARLAGRQGHFFPPALLNSQLAALEPPAPGELVLLVPAAGTPQQTAAEIISRLDLPGLP